MVGNLLVKPKTALQKPVAPTNSLMPAPVAQQPVSALGAQPVSTAAVKAPQTPVNSILKPTQPVSNTFTSGLNVQTLLEIQKKAQSNQALSNPDAVKDALYNYYKTNPNVKITGGMDASMLNEIQKKATGGIAMSAPSAEKNAIYNALKPQQTTQAQAPQQTKAYADVSQFLGGGANQQQTRDANGTIGPTDNGFANWNSNQSIPDYGAMTPDMIQQIMSGYTSGSQYYDPSKDPVYNSMLELAGKQADKAGLSTMEEMNSRGILNSTVTSDRVGQIKQGASDAVLGAIPGLSANFSNQQANNQAGMQNLLNSVLGAGQFQQTFGEDNRRFDKNFSLDEANTTGRYMSPEGQKALDAVLNAKKAVSMNISPEDKKVAVQQAEQGRQLLASMGFDIAGLDASTTYEQALTNSQNLGRNSIPQQKMDLERSELTGRDTSTEAQGLIQQVLQSKLANEQKGANKAANAKIANDARAKLSAMGFNVSGIDGNTTYAQAVKNAAKIGNPTLDAQKLVSDNKNFGREMNFKEQTAYIEADLKSRGYDLEEIKLSIDQFTADSDAEYKLYQRQIGISENNAKEQTNRAIGELSQARTAAEALTIFREAGSQWADQGVDNREVIRSIKILFPETEDALSGGGGPGYGEPSK